MIIIFFVILNLLILYNFNKIKIFKLNIDKPDNKRKYHQNPTPLAGGTILFINLSFYFIFLFFFPNLFLNEYLFNNIYELIIFIIISSSIFLLGFFDDKYNIKANKKFAILSSIILVFLLINTDFIIREIKFSFYRGVLELNDFSIPFTIFCFLVFMNAFNMFDGINLQSTLYSLIILISILFFHVDTFFLKILIISLFCFLYLNYKDYSFLGDSGTLYLSFIISYIFIKLYNLSYFNGADKIVVFMLLPGIDLVRLFVTRLLNKKNPLSSDRNHLHHLLISKYSYTKSILIIISLVLFPIILDNYNINNILNIFLTVLAYLIIFLKIRN